MKKIYVLMAVAIIGIGSCLAPVSATENIIDLGTIEYSNIHEKTLVVEISSSEFIDLQFISSDTDNTSLSIFSCWFSPLDNLTTYVFATSQIEVNWWFVNDIKGFIYQDNSTGQLYCINIDYSAITIPSNPLIEWMNKYNETAASHDELLEVFSKTLDELNATRDELRERWGVFNVSQGIFDNNTIAMEAMKLELRDLNADYNETKVLWTSAVTNASTFKLKWETLWTEHDTLKRDHDGLQAIYPIYIFVAIILTGVIITFYFKRKTMFQVKEKTDLEIEQDSGYNQEASKIDRFTAGILKTVRPKGKQEASGGPSISESQKDIAEMERNIDEIKKIHNAFQGSTVKDIQEIRAKVDVIETKLKI